ncbi:MAG: flagellar hook-associated protein FlgK [Casimicrobiaceae bacterium]
MSNILGIGASALAAAQSGLLTTGHNISNVNTPGFSRQETIQATRPGVYTGAGYLGQGVDVASVRRIYSDFLANRVLSSQAQASAAGVRQDLLGQIDNSLGDVTSGLSPSIDSFFSGINAVAANPSDLAARQVVLSSAQALVSRFQQLDGQLGELDKTTNARITSSVGTINALGVQIASINRRISDAAGAGSLASPPNDLLDQRDHLLAELNKQVGATAVPQEDGSYNVFLSNGQALVVGANPHTMTVVSDPQNPDNVQIGLSTGGMQLAFRPGDITGGELAGALSFRDGELAGARNELGRVALALGTAINAQHRLGQDLAGALGGDLFTVPGPHVQAALTNTGSATLAASVVDATQVTTSDYRLAYDGTNYTITRLDDGTAQTFATLPQTVDGVKLALSGPAGAGDSYLVRPTHFAARGFGVAITSAAQIAAAVPIRTSASAANLGTGAISQGGIDSSYPAAPFAAPITLTYSSGTGMLTGFPATLPVTVNSGTTTTTYAAGAPVPYTSGATIAFGGASFTLTGPLANGDTFGVTPNNGAIGDGRNAQLLAAVAGRAVVAGGASIQVAYAQLVSRIGTQAQQAQVEHDVQAGLLAQANAAQQSVSGVNLDEEAANLERFQQAYLAASKLIAIASTLFQSILDIR